MTVEAAREKLLSLALKPNPQDDWFRKSDLETALDSLITTTRACALIEAAELVLAKHHYDPRIKEEMRKLAGILREAAGEEPEFVLTVNHKLILERVARWPGAAKTRDIASPWPYKGTAFDGLVALNLARELAAAGFLVGVQDTSPRGPVQDLPWQRWSFTITDAGREAIGGDDAER
jgi:hypothetical protein